VKRFSWKRLQQGIQTRLTDGQFYLSEEESRRRGRQVTLWEALVWLSGISIVLAMPYWFGFSPLLAVFYGSLAALLWRLSKAMPVRWAFVIAVGVALVATALLVAMTESY